MSISLPDDRRTAIHVAERPLHPSRNIRCQGDDCCKDAEKVVLLFDDVPNDAIEITATCEACTRAIHEAIQNV